jgi:predicted flap endonuclease-1-like 5' DNA nuclease
MVSLEERIQRFMTGVEAETREARLERERERERLKRQTVRVKDDLTHIAGIGEKISSLLRSAGIDTFEKLATTNVDSIRRILEAENPSLLRLTNPSSWPEQAKIAAGVDWGTLTKLQNKT